MEPKKILELIHDDIAHLDEITADFNTDSLPALEEIGLAIFRANALLTELKLFQKVVSRKQSIIVTNESPDNQNFHSGINTDSIQQQIISDETEVEGLNASEPYKGQNCESGPEPLQTSEIVSPESLMITEPSGPTQEIVSENDPNPNNDPDIEPAQKKKSDITIKIEVEKSLNDKMGERQKPDNDFLSQEKNILGYPVTSINRISDAIGINDRYLFVRELFDNNGIKFETTVNTLDEQTSIQEAVNYLKMNFKWSNSEASQKFLLLVKRRFTK